MPNAKRLIADWNETGKTVYAIVRREADNYRLDDSDGSFASNPSDPYLSLSEDGVIKGRYEAAENRATWNDGRYTIVAYKQAGGSPAPASDTIIGSGEMYIAGDTEVVVDATISSRLATTGYTAPDNAKIDFIEKWILNKLVESPAGTWKLYDDDDATVLKTWTWTTATKTRSKAT